MQRSLLLNKQSSKYDPPNLEGRSTARVAFLDTNGRPLKVKQDFPELYETLMESVAK